LPDDFDAVAGKLLVGGDDAEPFGAGLGDQHAIEGVGVIAEPVDFSQGAKM
jgi:hypothetical protein